MKKLKAIFAICILTILITSCEKEGTQGPQGVQGPQGDAGPQGSANVKSSTYTITSLSSGSNYRYKKVASSIITSTIYSSGVVLAYVYTSSGYTAIPYTFLASSSVQQFYRGFVTVGQFELKIYNSDFSTPSVSLPFTLKLVAIDGARLSQKPMINLQDYNAVKTAFNLND